MNKARKPLKHTTSAVIVVVFIVVVFMTETSTDLHLLGMRNLSDPKLLS
jgi:hypothetical protein